MRILEKTLDAIHYTLEVNIHFLLFLSLKMTYPVRVQRALEVGMGSSLTDEHIGRVLQSDQRLLVI